MQCGYLILVVTHICHINGLLSRVMRSVTQCQCQGKDVLDKCETESWHSAAGAVTSRRGSYLNFKVRIESKKNDHKNDHILVLVPTGGVCRTGGERGAI